MCWGEQSHWQADYSICSPGGCHYQHGWNGALWGGRCHLHRPNEWLLSGHGPNCYYQVKTSTTTVTNKSSICDIIAISSGSATDELNTKGSTGTVTIQPETSWNHHSDGSSLAFSTYDANQPGGIWDEKEEIRKCAEENILLFKANPLVTVRIINRILKHWL